MQDLRAAAVQFQHAPGDKAANLATIRAFVEKAAAQQADLVVFPEMCITGYWHTRHLSREAFAALAEPVPAGPSTQVLLDLAATHGLTVGAGLIEEDAEGRFYNAYVVAMPDGRYACHRKLHVFVSEHLSAGDRYTVFDLPNGTRAGVLICYDNNLIENARMTALMGAEILLAPHQTGGCRSRSPRAMGAIDPRRWHERHTDPEALRAEFCGTKGRGWLLRWLPARAHDNGMFLVFSNGVGLDDDEVRTGGAMILDPYGEILAESTALGDDLVVADLDASQLASSSGQRWLRARRPELYAGLAVRTGREEETRAVRFGLSSSVPS
jgi:predicted amidohydrolase